MPVIFIVQLGFLTMNIIVIVWIIIYHYLLLCLLLLLYNQLVLGRFTLLDNLHLISSKSRVNPKTSVMTDFTM